MGTGEYRQRKGALVHGTFETLTEIDQAFFGELNQSEQIIVACVHKTNSAQHVSDFERCLQQACSISSIDFVVPVDWQSAAESIVRMRPHYFAIGPHQASYSKTIEIGIQEKGFRRRFLRWTKSAWAKIVVARV